MACESRHLSCLDTRHPGANHRGLRQLTSMAGLHIVGYSLICKSILRFRERTIQGVGRVIREAGSRMHKDHIGKKQAFLHKMIWNMRKQDMSVRGSRQAERL